jgi:hypothetical protein
MTTNRTPISRPPRHGKITPAAVKLFQQGLAAMLAGDSQKALDLEMRLDQALNRMKPWQFSPLQVEGGLPPSFKEQWQSEEWASALELRRELEKGLPPRTANYLIDD